MRQEDQADGGQSMSFITDKLMRELAWEVWPKGLPTIQFQVRALPASPSPLAHPQGGAYLSRHQGAEQNVGVCRQAHEGWWRVDRPEEGGGGQMERESRGGGGGVEEKGVKLGCSLFFFSWFL